MSKKTIQLQAQEKEVSKQQKGLSLSQKRRIIEQSPAVHQAMIALFRGRIFAATRFPHYGGFIVKLRTSYQQENATDFLHYLRDYLSEGHKYVSQIPDAQKAEEIHTEISALIEKYGVKAVSGCVLARLLS